ncbi:MAG: twin-arginine translocase TatA/TatE family subunit [Acidobacteriota bacterium]
MGRIGGWEWLVLLGILLLLFGASRLPSIGKGLGEGIRNFRDSFRSGTDGEEKDPKDKVENKSS